MKLVIDLRKKNEKKMITWRLNNMLLKWVNDEIKEKLENTSKQIKMKI